eukprot:747241-Hanusia_phi.AAC.1
MIKSSTTTTMMEVMTSYTWTGMELLDILMQTWTGRLTAFKSSYDVDLIGCYDHHQVCTQPQACMQGKQFVSLLCPVLSPPIKDEEDR